MRNIAAGASAIDVKRGLDRAVRVAIDSLGEQSRPVQSQRPKQQVATISAHTMPRSASSSPAPLRRCVPRGWPVSTRHESPNAQLFGKQKLLHTLGYKHRADHHATH